MKIAIHRNNPKVFFCKRWIEYCEKENIPYKIVNAYDNDIIEQLRDCDAFMWHHSNYDYKDALFAKQLLFSLEQSGITVFPNFQTNWHFDDKVGQKYLLEAINAPLVPSYVFYTKQEALRWVNKTVFPKVFKLRGGSGSSNVKLVKTKRTAIRLINKAFGRGFSQFDKINHLKFRYGNFKSGKENFTSVLKGIARLFIGTKYSNNFPQEKGYIYFQEFIPNNNFDIRIIVIGDKAFALKRLVRKGDFRASGSGNIIYDKNEIDVRCVQLSFNINRSIQAQSIAFDYVFDEQSNPQVVEMSYGFAVEAYDHCPGYWDSQLQWHECKFNPQNWMIMDLINLINQK